MTPLVFRPCACCRSSRGDGAKETAGRRVDAAESRPVMHPRDADSYCTSDVFTEAAAAASSSSRTGFSAMDTRALDDAPAAHQSVGDRLHALNAQQLQLRNRSSD